MPDAGDVPPALNERYRGESHRLALREDFRNPEQLADLIAAIANADGGAIIVGVDHSGVSTGVWLAKLQRFYRTALEQVEPRPTTELREVRDFRTDIAVISIERSPQLVLSGAGALVRAGKEVRAMSTAEIRAKLAGVAPEPEPGLVASTLAHLTSRVAELQRQAEARDRPWARSRDYGLGGLIGALIAWLLQWGLGR